MRFLLKPWLHAQAAAILTRFFGLWIRGLSRVYKVHYNFLQGALGIPLEVPRASIAAASYPAFSDLGLLGLPGSGLGSSKP